MNMPESQVVVTTHILTKKGQPQPVLFSLSSVINISRINGIIARCCPTQMSKRELGVQAGEVDIFFYYKYGCYGGRSKLEF